MVLAGLSFRRSRPHSMRKRNSGRANQPSGLPKNSKYRSRFTALRTQTRTESLMPSGFSNSRIKPIFYTLANPPLKKPSCSE